ncbi:putative tail tubular protein [uncultured Mediterranean phage uvMED]|nr:putative tail tubular protein [uncultured Mediterranean phage uvMED]|tara:strand:+ start:278 stop:868 length:591 start_codon:yes stop_codon:yes gene_type:complete
MASVVDICNSALNQIGASNIISLTEDSKSARILNQRYDFVRDAVFRAHPWNPLITRVVLAPDATAPAFEFTNQFTLPTDPFCLRVLSFDFHDIVYRVEGRKILCSEDTINLLYVGRITDPNQYDTLLIETIAAALAADIAYPLVGSNTLAQQLRLVYEDKLKEARFVDATEGTPASITSVTDSGSIEADTFIRSRF